MAIISVEVPDFIAKNFSSQRVVNVQKLYEEMDKNKELICFGKKWLDKEDFSEYLAFKKSCDG